MLDRGHPRQRRGCTIVATDRSDSDRWRSSRHVRTLEVSIGPSHRGGRRPPGCRLGAAAAIGKRSQRGRPPRSRLDRWRRRCHDDVLDPGVARLELDPAELRLDVVDPSLGLGRDDAIASSALRSTDDAVPARRSLRSARDLGRNVRSDAARSEARQQGHLRRIADRIAARVGADPDIEADDGSDLGQLDERDRIVPRPLDRVRPGDPTARPRDRPRRASGQRRAGLRERRRPIDAEIAPRDPRLDRPLAPWPAST